MWNLNKYGNKKVTIGNETFDSSKEYRRFCELKLLQRAGKISDLRRQVKFVLIPTQREPDVVGVRGGVKKGKVIEQECAYIADFVYLNEKGETVVEDAKGNQNIYTITGSHQAIQAINIIEIY